MFGEHDHVAATADGPPMKGALPRKDPPINKVPLKQRKDMLAVTRSAQAPTSSFELLRITLHRSRPARVNEGARSNNLEDKSHIPWPKEPNDDMDNAVDHLEEARNQLWNSH